MKRALFFLVVILSTLLIFLPLGRLVYEFFSNGEDLFPLLWDPTTLSIARATFFQATLSTLIASIVGLGLGIFFGLEIRKGNLWARRAQSLLGLSFVAPSVVTAVAWVVVLGRSGVIARWGVPLEAWGLDWVYSLRGVILAHVFMNAPWIALLVSQSLLRVPTSEVEAARTLGAGPIARLRTVFVPHFRWPLFGGMIQVFSLCSTSFALVLILGGGPPVDTLETAIFARLRFGEVDLPGALACAFWQLLINLGPWFFLFWIQRKEARKIESQSELLFEFSGAFSLMKPLQQKWRGSFYLLISLLFLAPLCILMGETLSRRVEMSAVSRVQVWEALGTSLGMGALTTVGSLLFGVAGVMVVESISQKKWARLLVEVLVCLPSGLSVLVLALGYWLTYREWIQPLSGSIACIVGLQVALFSPLVFRSLVGIGAISQSLLFEAARSLGAGPWQAFWTVEWPRWKTPFFRVSAMVMAISLGELGAMSLFYGEDWIPLPLLVSKWVGQYRFEEAQWLSVLLLVTSMAIFMMGSLSFKKSEVVR